MPTIKNIIIFIAIAAALALTYIFFIRSPDETPALVSSTPPPFEGSSLAGSNVTQDFLVLLLNVKNIKLNDAILSDSAFTSLRDSSITLIPDATEGRPNPFAPLGAQVAN